MFQAAEREGERERWNPQSDRRLTDNHFDITENTTLLWRGCCSSREDNIFLVSPPFFVSADMSVLYGSSPKQRNGATFKHENILAIHVWCCCVHRAPSRKHAQSKERESFVFVGENALEVAFALGVLTNQGTRPGTQARLLELALPVEMAS